MNQLPGYIPLVFVVTTGLTILIFYRATTVSVKTIFILAGWLIFQACLGITGFYQVKEEVMPRFLLLILPPVVVIAFFFITQRGRNHIDKMRIKELTLIHSIRIPVELVLFWLVVHKAVPQIMSFAGNNFDILAGLTAPVIYYFGFVRNQIPVKIILIWNFICLGLLINIVILAILSLPFPFQQFGMEQPAIALLNFPFVWLPCCIVPLVLSAHLVTIRRCLIKENQVREPKLILKNY